MNTRLALAACSAVLIAGLAGCSSQDGGESSGRGRVNLNGSDTGAVTDVQCAADGERTTITLSGAEKTTVVLTGTDNPTVESVNIGEVGSDGASLAYLQGVSPEPAQVTHDDGYTVRGTGMGGNPADPSVPVDMPFEIEATCP